MIISTAAQAIVIDSADDLHRLKDLSPESFAASIVKYPQIDQDLILKLSPIVLGKIQEYILLPTSSATKMVIKGIYGSGHFREPTTGEVELSESQLGEISQTILGSLLEKFSANSGALITKKLHEYTFTIPLYEFIIENKIFYFVREYLSSEAKKNDDSDKVYVCHRCSYRGTLTEIDVSKIAAQRSESTEETLNILKQYDPILARSIKDKKRKPIFYICPVCNGLNNATTSLTKTKDKNDITESYDSDLNKAQELEKKHEHLLSYMDMANKKTSPIKTLQKDYYQPEYKRSGHDIRRSESYITKMKDGLSGLFNAAKALDVDIKENSLDEYLPGFLNKMQEYHSYLYPHQSDKNNIDLQNKKVSFESANKDFLNRFNNLMQYANPTYSKNIKNIFTNVEKQFSFYSKYNFTPKKCPRCQVSVHPYDRVDVDYERISPNILRTEFLRHRLFYDEGRKDSKYATGLFSQKIRSGTDLLESMARLLLLYAQSGLSKLFSNDDALGNLYRELLQSKNVEDLSKKYSHQAFNHLLDDIKSSSWKQRFVTPKGFMGSNNYQDEIINFLNDKQTVLENSIASNFILFYLSKIKSTILSDAARATTLQNKTDPAFNDALLSAHEEVVKNIPLFNKTLKDYIIKVVMPARQNMSTFSGKELDNFINNNLSKVVLIDALDVDSLPLTTKKAFEFPVSESDIQKPSNRNLRCSNCGLIFPRHASEYADPLSSSVDRHKFKLKPMDKMEDIDGIESVEISDTTDDTEFN